MAVYVVDTALRFYSLLIIVYVLMSWFPLRGWAAELYSVLATLVEPYVGVFRRLVPTVAAGGAGLDLSPLVALLVLDFLIRPAVRSILVAVL